MNFRIALIAGLLTSPLNAAPAIDEDGWYLWRVDAHPSEGERCCYSPQYGKAACHLDGAPGKHRIDADRTGDSGMLRIFAEIEDGRTSHIRVLDESCAATLDRAPFDLGVIETDASIGWLKQQVPTRGDDALMAIASHEGRAAVDSLAAFADPSEPRETRKKALFWLAMERDATREKVLLDAMRSDKDPKVREHAIFAFSQSRASDRLAVLTELGQHDESSEVRAQTWFWLAQTDLKGAAEPIRDAVRRDPSSHVRKQAVFALSQLKNGDAVAELAAVLRDPDVDRSTREQALFWLAQSDSDEAFALLDGIIDP